MMGARGGKTDFQYRLGADSGMEDSAAAALAMRVDEFAHRKIQSRLPQSLDHEIALPRAVLDRLPVLHGAAAAYAEMRTDRRDAFCTRLLDVEQPAAVGVAGDCFDLDRFARQCAGNVNRSCRAVGDTVAAMAEPGDRKLFNHALPLSRTRGCRRRQGSVTV